MPGNESMKIARGRGRAAQSLVEMAMVLPVLALLTFGLLDFGRAYYFQVSITNAAREGARVAILNIYTGPQNPNCSSSNGYATCPVQTDANIITAVNNELTYSAIAPTFIKLRPAMPMAGLRFAALRREITRSSPGKPSIRLRTSIRSW